MAKQDFQAKEWSTTDVQKIKVNLHQPNSQTLAMNPQNIKYIKEEHSAHLKLNS